MKTLLNVVSRSGALVLLMLAFTCRAAESNEPKIRPLAEPEGHQYVKAVTLRDTVIQADIAGVRMPVATLNKGQSIDVDVQQPGLYQVRFGNAQGDITPADVRILQKDKIDHLLDGLIDQASDEMEVHQKNILTKTRVPVYDSISYQPKVFAYLNSNLRYPVLGKIQDSNNVSWYLVNLADQLKYLKSSDVELDHGIPVLTYHHLLTNAENKYFRHTSTTTSDAAFNNQMAYLKQAGYQTLTMEQLDGYVHATNNLPARAVVLTFDDGLKSVYKYAYPILKKYDLNAVAFIISSRIKYFPQKWDPNTLQFLSIQEIDAMSDVFEIESHTHFLHKRAATRHPILLSKSYHNIYRDFVRSKKALAKFNHNADYLSYPFGGYNSRAIKAAKEAGYRLAVTTEQGTVQVHDNPYTLKRVYVLRTDPVQVFAEKIRN